MLKVGLTGGIGSGKSEVSRLLASYGAVVVDADAIAREVVAPGTPGLRQVVAEFGPDVLGPDGTLDRPRLGALVFADEGARRRLEAIVHPLVRQRSQELMDAAPGDAVVVYDVPLLVENDLGAGFDVVVVVDAPEETRLARLLARRGMREDEARARIAAQAGRDQRLAAADVVLDNAGSLHDLGARVRALWEDLRRRPGGAHGAGTGTGPGAGLHEPGLRHEVELVVVEAVGQSERDADVTLVHQHLGRRARQGSNLRPSA